MSDQTSETSVIDLQPAAPSPAEPNAGTAKPRCRHRVRSGAYCRLPAADPKTGLCFRHTSLRLEEVDSGDLSEELVCGIKEFRSAADINHVLGELYKLLAANKISPRRGSVMAFTCSLLLRTLPAIQEQEGGSNQTIIVDIDSAVARRALEARAKAAQLHQAAQHKDDPQRQDPKHD